MNIKNRMNTDRLSIKQLREMFVNYASEGIPSLLKDVILHVVI